MTLGKTSHFSTQMKNWSFQVLLSFALLMGLLACSSTQRSALTERSAAIAIVMDGGGVPTAEQIAEVYAKVRPNVARLGYVLAANPRSAEVVVHVKFTPDLSGGAGGHVSILTVASNADERQQAIAARDQFKESSEKAIRSQTTEPR